MRIKFIQKTIDVLRRKKKVDVKYMQKFFTTHERPVYSCLVKTVSDLNINSFPTLGIVIQGPILKENDFTFETVKLYKKHFSGNTKIVISTWDDEDKEYLEKFKIENVYLKLSKKPQYQGISNVNYQIESSKNGLKYAKELGCKYAIKTRCDQRFYAVNVEEYFFNLLKVFPLDETVKGQRERLIALSLNTFKYRLFGISDMFLFGDIDDMINYWSPDYDMRKFEEIDEKHRKSIKDYSECAICEVYFVTQFLKRINIDFKFTLEDSFKIFAQHFIIIDKESLDLFWPKYNNLEYRWLSYVPNDYEELTFKEWFNLYNNYKKVSCGIYLSDLRQNDLILTRTACLGNFVLDRFYTDIYNVQNHQKNRVDYMLKIHSSPELKVQSDKISDFIPREDIKYLIHQQEYDIFQYNNPKIFIMDSFSELTDKLFFSKNTSSMFLAHYSDITHCAEFDDEYKCLDVIDNDLIENEYDQFFSLFNKTYGEIPIIFINFPAKFDEREKYKEREKIIKNSLIKLCKKYKNIIFIDPDYVEKSSYDDFPYHFSEYTYDCIAKKIAALKLLVLK